MITLANPTVSTNPAFIEDRHQVFQTTREYLISQYGGNQPQQKDFCVHFEIDDIFYFRSKISSFMQILDARHYEEAKAIQQKLFPNTLLNHFRIERVLEDNNSARNKEKTFPGSLSTFSWSDIHKK